MAIEWHDWGDEAFALARERKAPVLLFLRASWCRWCRELEERVLASPQVARIVGERFVAVRVDKDRRPDVDQRYAHGGWPTLAYLDESGERIAADNWMDPEPLARRLSVVADYYAENRDEIRRHLAEAAERLDEEARRAHYAADVFPAPDLLDWVARTVAETADPEHGGWGSKHKFPHPEAIDFALIRWSQTGDDAMRQLVLRTLGRMQAGQIHDRVEGGFYRYATRRDWSAPHAEKMLDSNSARLFAYLEAYQAFGEESFRETAEGILRWMEGTLYDPETGAYRGSQDADPEYANLTTIEARRRHGAPTCDPAIYANWNGMAASALFKAAVVLDEPRWADRARGVLDFLLAELVDERLGAYHYWDGTYHLPGLLSDQAYVLRALCDAAQYASWNQYLEPARRLADTAIETLRGPSGAFFDKPHDPAAPGELRRRNRSLLENAVLAEALLRLSWRLFQDDYRDVARAALASFADDYKAYGPYVAGYARAIDLYVNPPVVVSIVGAAEAPGTRALTRAALRPYVASRIVVGLDPSRDAALFAKSGLPAPDPDRDRGPRAYVQRGRESRAETSDPERLPALMVHVERSG